MGGDSAGVNARSLSISVREDKKVFKNGSFIMGFTSSFRMGQVLQYNFDPPRQTDKQSDMQYMVSDFIDAVRKVFGESGYGKVGEKSDNVGGTFLVGYNGVLYTIQSDFQVAINSCGYDAVGCGSDLALGALHATNGMKPKERIKKALEAASTFSAGVLPPFTYQELVKKK